MSIEQNDPLDALSVDAAQMDKENRMRLARLIQGYAQIDFTSGEIFLPPAWEKLTSKQKVLMCLLSRKALNIKNPDFKPDLTWNEISDISHLPDGTIRPKLSELVAERAIAKTERTYQFRLGALQAAEAVMQLKTDEA